MRVKFILPPLSENDIHHYLINRSERKRGPILHLQTIGVFALIVLFACSALGRQWSSGQDLEYTDGTHVMPYRLYLPANYSETNRYPVVLFLHGMGETGSNNEDQVKVHIAGLINRTESDYPAILIAPQLPNDKYWYYHDEDLSIEILVHVLRNYAADERRIYLTGLSMGANGVTRWADYVYPRLFAAIAPLSGGSSRDVAEDHPLRQLPRWYFCGENDYADIRREHYLTMTGLSEIEWNATCYGYLSAVHGPIRYTELTGEGHNIWDLIYNHTETDLYDWMFSQKRPPRPFNQSRMELSGNNLLLQTTTEIPFATALLKTTPDLNLPLSEWTTISTNRFDTNSDFTFTIPIDKDSQRAFYRVTSP